MKRMLSLLLAAALCLLLVTPALAAGGTEDDPVISFSYLNGTLRTSITKDVYALIERQSSALTGQAFEALAEQAALHNRTQDLAHSAPVYGQGRLLLKQGDQLLLAAGAQVTLLYGKAAMIGGNLIDITAGARTSAGAPLTADHCYMMNNLAEGGVTVDSETAEIFIDGVYTLLYAAGTDYASCADALYEMGLFSGSAGAITGYALEQSCTRIEGLVMFLRLIGKIDEAAAYTGSHPFKDVPASHWAYRYLAYAYANNLAYGTSTTAFSPEDPVSAQDYITFLLRALHYDEGTEFVYRTVLTDCVDLGLFSQAEIRALSNGSFLRSRMVYLSYFALYGTEQQSGSALLMDLIAQNRLTLEQAVSGACKVSGWRIS